MTRPPASLTTQRTRLQHPRALLEDLARLGLRRLRQLAGDRSSRDELTALEDELGRAMVPDDYLEITARLRALRIATSSEGPLARDLAIDLLRHVALCAAPIAHGLRLRSVQADLSALLNVAAVEDLEARPVRVLVRSLETLAVEAERAHAASEVLRACVAEVLEALQSLCGDEQARRVRLEALRDRVRAASELSELEELREALLFQATDLVQETAAREQEMLRAGEVARAHVQRTEELERKLVGEQASARTDPLTGLSNRRALDEALERFRLRASETGVFVLDLDHFKTINDTHGHAAGDDVLRWLAGLLRAELRGDDEAFRIGGEEFVVLLPDSSWTGARVTAERLRARVASQPVPTGQGELRTSISIGLSIWIPSGPFERAFAEADRALYRAKQAGRDRVVG